MHEAVGLPFYECHVATPIEVCEKRDIKGLYKKARAGIIKDFTGVGSVYEEPLSPDMKVGHTGAGIEACVKEILGFLEEKGILPPVHAPLVDLFVPAADVAAKTAEAAGLTKLPIDKITMQWLQCLAEGWASPVNGFMREEMFLKVLHFNALDTDTNMSVPIVCPCTDGEKAAIEAACPGKVGKITLTYEGKDIAIMTNPEVYNAIKEERCSRQWGIYNTDKDHPYVILTSVSIYVWDSSCTP